MKITFILPGLIKIPMGGVKVVHEYANRLADRGHTVSIIYPLELSASRYLSFLRKVFINAYDKLTDVNKELYYTPSPRVNVLVVKKLTTKYIPEGDAVIAAGWQTAKRVSNLPEIHGKTFYLLQHFETYFRQKKEVLKTFHLPLLKIAIAQWIIDELREINEIGIGPLGNSINTDEFFLSNQKDERQYHIIMIYHHLKVKGPTEGIKVLKILKSRIPNFRTIIIASRKPIHNIPRWVEVIIRPSIEELRNLYNSSKVLLHTSRSEGWGLPVMEAMACGCAVVAAENKGVKEYLTHEYNALLSPIGNTKSLTTQVTLLLHNTKLLNKLTCNGLKSVKQYSWDSIISYLENILMDKM